MSFFADQQTLDDLNIQGKFKQGSIFNLFNRVTTTGGERLLQTMFRAPLEEENLINERVEIFNYFSKQSLKLPLDREEFMLLENYLRTKNTNNLLFTGLQTAKNQLVNFAVQDETYQLVLSGIHSTISMIKAFRTLFSEMQVPGEHHPYGKHYTLLGDSLKFVGTQIGKVGHTSGALSLLKVARYDYLFRNKLYDALQILLEMAYHMDVCLAVNEVALEKNLVYPRALPKVDNRLHVLDMRHPALDQAKANAVSFGHQHNLIFLTGANMAGKSTLMKTLGVTVYLAHMGFPVAAKKMVFSVKDGIYTSINVPDSLGKGLSHFYAEVLRVKKVAEAVDGGKDLYVLFDELFKGTNVKDAYDATLQVTAAFSVHNNCFFIISTHIIEVGEALGEQCKNILFAYLPTIMDGQIPKYTYQLKEGITADRQGMTIIRNEGILDMLKINLHQ
ncbi:MutS-related protein [Pedobacter sp. AW31-3R]|uniref:MutS-related protein n=1 Tax=Pedobacter sp. AW31-3R TaxID=3445781 RepID=UPI003F9F4FCF